MSNPTRLVRNSGEDITRRTIVVQNDGHPSVATPGLMTGPMDNQGQANNQSFPFGVPPGPHAEARDYDLQHALSPHSTAMSSFSQPPNTSQPQYPPHQPPTQAPAWSLQGHGSFRSDVHNDQIPYMQAPGYSALREHRIDSGYASTTGRSSFSHGDSGTMDSYNMRTPYAPTSVPAMQIHSNDQMQAPEWQMVPAMQTYSGYDSMEPPRHQDMTSGPHAMPSTFMYQGGSGPSAYAHNPQATSQP